MTFADDGVAIDATEVHEKFRELQSQLNAALIERDEEVEALLLGLIAQEHVLFVGDPGTGKSYLCETLTGSIDGANIFTTLLTKFSTPEELFGPVSISGLKNDEYKRLVDGFLPTCEIAFIDEVWKASSAILNTLLRLMNERKFVNGSHAIDCPLRLMVAASNEWPQGEELAAAFDRFLIRKVVKPIKGDANIDRLMFDELPPVSASLSLAELDAACADSAAVPLGDAAKDALREIRRTLRQEGIEPGDRRCRKSIKLAKAAAWMAGETEVLPEHLECLQWSMWRVPGEQIDKSSSVICKIANPVGAEVTGVIAEFEDIASKMPQQVDGNFMTGMKKLGECVERMKSLHKTHPTPRVKTALDYVSGRTKEFRIKAVDA